MSKPSEIPEDVWKVAEGLSTRPITIGGLYSENYVVPIARAIMAEREECAKVALRRPDSFSDGQPKDKRFFDGWIQGSMYIAKAIRERSDPGAAAQ